MIKSIVLIFIQFPNENEAKIEIVKSHLSVFITFIQMCDSIVQN